MTDYLDSSNVRCSRCGIMVNTADPACDCQYEEETEHECPECGITLDAELFPTLRACYDHEEDREVLREYAAALDQYINSPRKTIRVMADKIEELEAKLKDKP